MKQVCIITVTIQLIFMAGCTQQYQIKVTYRSDPPGGTLYKLNGELCGPCPKVFYYDLDQKDISRGYIDVEGLMVCWPTGPERKSGDAIRITVDGTDRVVTFIQPTDAPDSKRDTAFEAEKKFSREYGPENTGNGTQASRAAESGSDQIAVHESETASTKTTGAKVEGDGNSAKAAPINWTEVLFDSVHFAENGSDIIVELDKIRLSLANGGDPS
ncbi:MAG: hypothetical protein JSW47_04750 [Phycisphaerales bacterium]|nr:MAG: hypothetical protein JSW47_04750 [Phycisphaerales bacterium]